MKTPYKLLLSLALTFASVIAPSLIGRAGGESFSSLSAQTIGDAFYIYRNDGGFNAFFREEVDSIAYSCYDVDSLLLEDFVTQVVFTEDSVYRIPLEAIDSVSFVQPKTVYKEDVVMIHSLIDYILRVEGKTLYISADIPSPLIPKVGDVLYFEAVTELFPEGFSGRVSRVTNGTEIIVECEQAALEDIYEQVTECLEFDVIPNNSEVKSLVGNNFSRNSYTLPVHFGADYLGVGASIDGSITIKVHGKSVKQLEIGKEPYVDLSATVNIDTELSYSFTEGLSLSRDFKKKEIPVTLPNGLVAKFLITPFLECSVQGALTTTVNTYSSQTLGVRYAHGRIKGYSQRSGPTLTAEASLSGSASAFAGLKVQGSVGFVGDLGKLTVAIKAGPRVEGKFTVASTSFDNTNGYDINRDNKITAHGRVALEATAGLYLKVLGAEVGKLEASVNPFTWDFLKKSWYVVPQFSNMQYAPGDDLSEALISARVSRDLISPMSIGMALFDSNKQLVEKQQASNKYKKASDFSNPFTISFADLTPGKRYTVYPYVRVMGDDYLASPSLRIGEDVTAETGEATDIKSKTATISGRVTGEDASRHEIGVYYVTSGSEDWQSIKAERRNNDGTFTVQLTGLEKDMEYAYCTYVNMGSENLYGDVLKFRTAKGLTVITGDATEVTDSSAVLHGQLSDYEIALVKEYGISYSTSPDDIQYVPASSISDDGSFSVKLTELSEQTKYYYTAYAYINDDEEEYYGEAKNFTTSEQKISTVTTGEATEITSSSATLSGFIQDYDADVVTVYGIKYFLGDDEPIVIPATNIVDGTFSVQLSNLSPNKTYSYYAYIIQRESELHGETKTFTTTEPSLCPDANHPHMIDLGIGTLWSCCNVGASAPEQYGNYYAWGETQPKSVYNWDTYQYGYYHDDDGDYSHLVNIGSDISGTQYDAARANWGAPWRMPTFTECRALLHQCTSEWTTINGIYGRKFTGPNGGTIFLPAAGFRWDDGLYYAGSYGYFWSSSLEEGHLNRAWDPSFDSGGAKWSVSGNRSIGQSVRPVN